MRDSVTFIHAADLHLDAPFQGVSAENERVGRELAEATYSAWSRIVDAALQRQVDFVVIAGDVYNTADRSVHAESRFRDGARRLAERGIGLYVVHGNHDPLSGRSAGLEMPENLRVFPAHGVERIEAVNEDGFVCAIYGRSFGKAAETDDFAPGYVRDDRDTVAIGLLHSNVGGNTDYEPYAPATLEGLRARKMDYWALGHIHKTQVLSDAPVAIYAGSPQGLNPKETGGHGCYVVTISATRRVDYEALDLAPVAWAQIAVDVSEASGIDEVERMIGVALEDVSSQAGRPAIARVNLTGASPAHSLLLGAGAMTHLVERLRAAYATAEPWAWLDRLTNATSAIINVEGLADSPHFPGEVVRVADELGRDESALDALVEQFSAPLRNKIDGYEPGLSATEILQRARDRALSLLVTETGGGL